MKRFTAVQIGIGLLACITGLIHLVILNIRMGHLDLLFTLNGLGYLGLIFLYLAPIPLPILTNNHHLVRWALLGFTLVTILAWISIGERSALGYGTQVVQVALVCLLLVDKNAVK